MAGFGVMGGFLFYLWGIRLKAASYSFSAGKEEQCLDSDYCSSLVLPAILHSRRFYKHHGSQGGYF